MQQLSHPLGFGTPHIDLITGLRLVVGLTLLAFAGIFVFLIFVIQAIFGGLEFEYALRLFLIVIVTPGFIGFMSARTIVSIVDMLVIAAINAGVIVIIFFATTLGSAGF
jgi:hypothetical protein